MAVAEEPPKDIIDNELKRSDTQKLLKLNFGREGQTWTNPEYRVGYMFAFELSERERELVTQHREQHGMTLLEAMKDLGYTP